MRLCDRFTIDPDRALELDASVIGLLQAEQYIKAGYQ